jgi:CBS domain-containing protein
MKVAEMMRRDVETLRPDDELSVPRDLVAEKRIRHFPVVEDGRLVGVVSDRDLLRTKEDARVRDVMAEDVITISSSEDVKDAALTMLTGSVGCLPVVDQGKLVGIVTESDILRLFAGE